MKRLIVMSIACLLILALAGCSATQKGAVIGGAVGAGAGGIIGHQSGHGWEGAGIGAATGAAAGALIGHYMEKDE